MLELECPNCQNRLPHNAHFCNHCGTSLSGIKNVTDEDVEESTIHQSNLLQQNPTTNAENWLEVQTQLKPLEPEEPALSPEPEQYADSYERKKRELETQRTTMAASMASLLPFVYENHRAENQELFTSTLTHEFSLEDPIWGRVAFVLGAYGNYMYRYPLSAEQKQQVWHALLWAVYYERCYRRKYLAQRCQQLLHFLQGCASDTTFMTYALADLDELYTYLEVSSLKKLEETLQQLPVPPMNLLQCVSRHLAELQAKKQAQQVGLPVALKPTVAVKKGEYQDQSALDERETRPNLQSQHAIRFTPELTSQSVSEYISPGLKKEPVQPVPKVLAGEITPTTRKLLSFFNDAQCQEFFASLRAARLEIVNQLLQSVRLALFTALARELSTAESNQYQPPRRSIRLGKKNADRFVEARRLLNSPRPNEQQMALRLFEQGARETTHPDYELLAREWMFYARAVTQGGHRVVNDWESNLQRDEASWEEIWNLAVFYQQTGYPVETLRVLTPGLNARNAPVEHLRFALACALRLLLESGRYSAAGHAFLVAYLEQWPHPLASLAWLVLVQEARGPLHPRQQAQRLSAFQELLEHPVNLPEPQKDLSDARVAALEELLVEKVFCAETWSLWIHDYAEHHLRNYQAWTRLAETSERLRRLDAAEHALQHLVEIQYHHDYARYQEGSPLPRAEYLRRNLEKLFEFYQRYNLTDYAAEAFHSCYPSLHHLWQASEPANRKLIALTRPYLEAHQIESAQTISIRRESITRELGKTVTVPLEPFNADKRVGIFVDYENIARFIPRETDIEMVGQALLNYAAQFGTVVCQWASASPHNLSNLADVRIGLESAHFKVRFPRRELQFSTSKKNLADFALLECLSEATINERPEIYLIVSGDRDYYERICSLLDAGHTVRVLASADSQHLSLRYRELDQQRARERQAAGHAQSNFFIDDLEEILYSQVTVH